MEDSATLDMDATVDVALKDTQEDEYYGNIVPEGIRKTFKSLRENPYPGLRPFKTSEANVFFGRKEITFDLISKLATSRFLAVLGASGSGKSSLVRAGLLPGLKTLPGKHSLWKVAVCRPGKNPFGNLAIAIGKAGIAPAFSNLEIWKSISSSSYGFEEMYRALHTPDEYNTLIVIDQFEELFRFKKDNGTTGKNDAALFVKMLIDISKIESLNTYVMITMRSEYLGDCVQFADLVDEINSGQFLVPRLKINQLKDAIMEPAGFANASVDPVCANRLIGEIGDNMDQLPVLQHALRRSYEEAKKHKAERNGIKVIYADYDEIGRMENALDKHAEEIMQEFDHSQKKCCRILFQSITDRATDGRGIRRPLSFSTIHKICTEAKEAGEDDNKILQDLKIVIERFRADSVNFLMPPDNVPLRDNTEVDISHESLMRTWKKLVRWIEIEAKDADLLKILLAREDNEYFQGSRLLSFKDWIKAKRDAITWAGIYKPADTPENDYALKFSSRILLVDKSVELDNIAQTEKETRRQNEFEQELKNRRRRFITILLSMLFLFMLAGMGLLWKTNREASISKIKVESQNNELKSKNDTILNREKNLRNLNDSLFQNKLHLDSTIKQLSDQKLILEDQNSKIIRDSALLAKRNDKLNTANAELISEKNRTESLNSSLQTAKDELLKYTNLKVQSLQNLALAVKHAEKSLAIPYYDSNRQVVKTQLALVSYKLLQESGIEEMQKLQPQIYTGLYNAVKGTGAADEQVLLVTSYPRTADRQVFAGVPASGGKQPFIYLTAEDNKLYTYNLLTGEKGSKLLYNNKNLVSIESSGQGRWLAINTLSNELLLRNLDEKGGWDTLLPFGKTVRCARFSPDGNWLYVFTKDSMLHTLDMKTIRSKPLPASQKINHLVEDLAISNNFIYAVTSTGNVVKWERKYIQSGKSLVITIPKNINNRYGDNAGSTKNYRGTKIGCSANDDFVVWGNENGEVFYCEPRKSGAGSNLTRFVGPVTDIAFSDSGKYLAIASYDKSIRIFQLRGLQAEAPMELRNDEGPITSVFFQADNKNPGVENLYAVISPGLIRIYPMDINVLACKLEKINNIHPSPVDERLYFDEQIREKIKVPACKQ